MEEVANRLSVRELEWEKEEGKRLEKGDSLSLPFSLTNPRKLQHMLWFKFIFILNFFQNSLIFIAFCFRLP